MLLDAQGVGLLTGVTAADLPCAEAEAARVDAGTTLTLLPLPFSVPLPEFD